MNLKYGPFDIIIDDGSHRNDDMVISFETLFPVLKCGGMYVVEDLHCCYWYDEGNKKNRFIDRIIKNRIIDSVNSSGKMGIADKDNLALDSWFPQGGHLDWDEGNIKSMHLYQSIVFIEKE